MVDRTHTTAIHVRSARNSGIARALQGRDGIAWWTNAGPVYSRAGVMSRNQVVVRRRRPTRCSTCSTTPTPIRAGSSAPAACGVSIPTGRTRAANSTTPSASPAPTTARLDRGARAGTPPHRFVLEVRFRPTGTARGAELVVDETAGGQRRDHGGDAAVGSRAAGSRGSSPIRPCTPGNAWSLATPPPRGRAAGPTCFLKWHLIWVALTSRT